MSDCERDVTAARDAAAVSATDPARFFADADVFYPSSVTPYRAWGGMGMRLLRRMEAATNARLEEAGYVEIRLPSICPASRLERFLGSNAKRLVRIMSDPNEQLALTPFADLEFVDHVRTTRALVTRRTAAPQRAYLWSRAVLAEGGLGFLDFGEYAKCEVFSLHRQARQAVRAWEQLNDIYRSLCVDDFNLDVICGRRPAVTAFPLTARTFAAELSQQREGFQTAVVSHVMTPAFMTENGFPELTGCRLNSACFSQKLLAGLLLHHRDEWGLRVPPALVPWLGVVVGSHVAMERLNDRALVARHRLCLRRDRQDPVGAMIEIGAVWSLKLQEESDDGTAWLLYRRGALDEPPQRHTSLDGALQSADAYVEAFARLLQSQSRERTQAALTDALSQADAGTAATDRGGPVNRVLPCCALRQCQTALADIGLPKLLFRLQRILPCASCGRATDSYLLFEREERYTSFYVPLRSADDAKSAASAG